MLAEAQFPHGLKHAAEIIPIIDRLAQQQQWRPRDIQQLYVSAGPGSFTGLRIGITLAKTMALATGAKIVAVPSVRVLAENAPAEARHVIVVLDAKREQIYTARFERRNSAGGTQSSGIWTEVEPAHLESLAGILDRAPRPVHLLGEGIPFHRRFIQQDESIIITSEESWRAQASVVARLGLHMAARGEFADPYRLVPIYIRPPEAEEKLQAASSLGPAKSN